MTTQHAYRVSSHGLRFPFARMVSVLVTVTMIVTAFLTSFRVANAQEAEVTADASAEASASEAVAVHEAGEFTATADTILQEVLQDFQVTQQDLGATDTTILPDSPLHMFTEIGWFVTEALTFDPVADAELKLEHANQELYEIQLLTQTEGVANAEVAGDIVDAAERITDRIEEIADVGDDLQAAAATNPAVEQLVLDVVEHQVNQEKVLEVVEEQIEAVAPADEVVALQEAREESVEEVATVLVEVVEEPEAIVEVIDQVLEVEAADGSAFAEVKNFEIIEKLEDAVVKTTAGTVEAEVVAALDEVQESTVERFGEKLEALPEEERAEKLVDYIEAVPGDEAYLFAAFDSLKDYALPEDVLLRLEEMKDVVAARVSAEFEESDDPDIRAAFFERFTDASDFGDVRILSDMTDRIAVDDPAVKAEMEAYREKGIKLFTERFTDALSTGQAEQFRALSIQMAEKPDPTTMQLMMALESEVRSDPAKAAFVDEMQGLGQKMRTVFEEKFDRYGDYFMQQVATSDPRDLATMKQFAQQYQPAAHVDLAAEFGEHVFEVKGAANEPFLAFGAPPEGTNPFAAFESQQKSFITEHVQSIDDPEVFRAMQERFLSASPDVVKEMQSYGNFSQVFNNRASYIQEVALAKEAEHVRTELQQQQAATLLDQLSGVTNEAARQQILQQAQTQQATLLEQELKSRENDLKAFSSFNPFCDAACQQVASRRFDAKFEQHTEQLKEHAHEDVGKQFEQFKVLEQSGDLEKFKAEFEKQGAFPGRGATGGIFPGQGATGGIFPGLGRPEGFEIPAPGEVPDTLRRPLPVEEKPTPLPVPLPVVDEGTARTHPKTGYPKPEVAPKPVEEPISYPKPGETGYRAPTPEEIKAHTGETGTYPKSKPTGAPGSFDDLFKTYQPKPGETTTYPKPTDTTTVQPTPGTTTYPNPGEPGYHTPTADELLRKVPGTTLPGTTVPSTGTTVPGTTLPGTTLPGTTVPSTGTTVPTTQPITTQPVTTQPTTAPMTEPISQPHTEPTYTQPTYTQPTYTAPTTGPAPTYTAPTYTAPPPDTQMMMPHASIWRRLARALYAFLTFPARAFGL